MKQLREIFKVEEKAEEIGLSPKTNPPTHTEKSHKQHKKHQNFDYTTIADRLRTVSLRNNSYPTGVVKPFYGILTFPLTTKAVLSKGHTLKNCK